MISPESVSHADSKNMCIMCVFSDSTELSLREVALFLMQIAVIGR